MQLGAQAIDAYCIFTSFSPACVTAARSLTTFVTEQLIGVTGGLLTRYVTDWPPLMEWLEYPTCARPICGKF